MNRLKSRLSIRFLVPLTACVIFSVSYSAIQISKEVTQATDEVRKISQKELKEEYAQSSIALTNSLISKAASIGQLLAISASNYVVSFDFAALQELQQMAAMDEEVAFIGFDDAKHKPLIPYVETGGNRTITQRFPILAGKNRVGDVIVGMSPDLVEQREKTNQKNFLEATKTMSSSIDSTLTNIHRTIFFSGGITLTIIASVIVFLFKYQVTSPLRRLSNAADVVAAGNLGHTVDLARADELGRVATAFNNMSMSLKSTTFSKEYVDSILQSMSEMLIVTDAEGTIQTVNHATIKNLGYSKDELIYSPLSMIIEDTFPILHKKSNTQNMAQFFTTIKQKNGNSFPIELSVGFLNYAHMEHGLVIAAKDITERTASQKQILEKTNQLEKANKQLDQFAYVVSHDLKAPLRAISNLSLWIEEDLGPHMGEDSKKQMTLLRGRVSRMEGLINGILEYSRIGRVTVDIMEVDVRVLLNEIIEMMPIPQGYMIAVDGGMPIIRTARVQLSQVFANLISNAIKYRSKDDGHIDIKVRDIGDYYEFSVKDDGPGIAPQFHEKVFQIFQTLNARDKFESTGIGLSLVQKIVESHGGFVKLESDTGKGANFIFSWPKQSTEAAAA